MSIVNELFSSPNIDSYGLLTEANGDGGDSIHREGALLFALWLLKIKLRYHIVGFEKCLYRTMRVITPLINGKNGRIRRHVDESKWYGDWERGSRDQYYALIGIGLFSPTRLRLIFRGHLERCLLFTTNFLPNTSSSSARRKIPDLTGPGFWALYIRLFKAKRLYWLLHAFDLSLVAQALIWCFWRGKDVNDSDVWNTMQAILLAETRMPTYFSGLARRVFSRLPKLDDVSPVNSVQQRLNHYTRDGGVRVLARAYEPITERFFKSDGRAC